MSENPRVKVSTHPEPKAGSLRDRVRALVQAEVARAEPADTARRSLELIVETAVRAREENGALQLSIVDDSGEVRTRMENGQSVPFAVADYIDELRHKHPTLFKARTTERAPVTTGPEPAAGSAMPTAASATPSKPSPAQPSRDWLDLAGSYAPPKEEQRNAPIDRGRFGSALRSRAAALGAVGPLMASSVGRLRDRLKVGRAQNAAEPAPVVEPVPVLGSAVRRRRWLPVAGATAALAILLMGSALVVPRLMNPGDPQPQQVASKPSDPAPESSQPEPTTTGTVAQAPATAPGAGPLRGVPEVLDTTTLRLQDRVVRLFGVEWARGGGDPDDLVKYLRGREVSCTSAGGSDSYRCNVEGQDLSRVVLFNGGGRATSDASPELRAAEDHARSGRLGVWRDSRTAGP